MEKKPNRAIACTVSQCAHHAGTCDFCMLDRITVGTHEPDPTETRCVDCESFDREKTGTRREEEAR